MKRTILFILLSLSLVIAESAWAEPFQDFSPTKITAVYSYAMSDGSNGWSLIRISSPHNSPEGYLVLPGSLVSPVQRAMLAMALQAKISQSNCSIRVTQTASGYWIVNMIQIN